MAAMNETFGAWRESQHDDLVLAVAAWRGEREPESVGFVPYVFAVRDGPWR